MNNQLTPIPENITQIGLIGIFAIISLGFIGITIMSVVLFKHKDGKDIIEMLKVVLESNRGLQLITIAAVIVAVMFLSLIGQINNNGVIALLSGISGYVLGNLGGKTSKPARKQDSLNKQPSDSSADA